jgi:SpoIVB peptidase S55
MQIRGLPIAVLLTITGLGVLVAAAPQAPATPANSPAAQSSPAPMHVDEIRPGMVAVGRTVFEGTRVEEFKVNILGVLENVIGTRRNLILARLEGGPLANTGVIAGMSGSPVYVDGRLIGAVSYALGAFSKEPIAGITPIAEMTDSATLAGVRPPGAKIQIDLPLTRDNLTAALRKALNWNRPFAEGSQGAELQGVNAVAGLAGGQLGALLRPIATPLVMSGFEPEVGDLFGSAFGSQGFVPTGGSAAAGLRAGEMPFDGPLKAGDAIGVMLVNGDLQMGGTGTVTHIEDDRVYAFGHPLYNLGPTEFPMTRAYVYTVLPSLFSSFKLSTTGDVIGTFLQDRATTIAGRLGPGPRMIPVTLNLTQASGSQRTFNFEVVNDQLFTPLMTYAALLNTLSSYERQFGAATFSVRGLATVKDHEAITFDDLFSTNQSAMDASAYIVAPLTYLLGNDYEKVEVSGLELTIGSAEEPRKATLERAWIDDPRPRAGRTVPLKVLLRTYRGEEEVRTLPIQIPANATGTLSVMVTDGARLEQIELRESRTTPQLRSVDQVIRSLNKARRNNTLYVRLLGAEAGAVVSGEVLSSLPPSVLAVLEADRNGGNFNPVRTATIGEWELLTGHAVTGSRTLSLTVSAN